MVTKYSLTVVCLLLASVLIPSAAANDIPPPPEDFQARYDEATGTVVLNWTQPVGGPYSYNVYRDGELIATTAHVNYTDAIDASQIAFHSYHVTTQGETESIPTAPLIVYDGPAGHHVPPCTIVGVWLLEEPPFVSWEIYERCIPVIGPGLELPGDYEN